jgi:oligoribonuclease NrnB/cAMP/cGMP phosphodiesterase (DHH superfamily)
MLPQAEKAVVIYHDKCIDGFGSAWAFHMLKEKDYGAENVAYVPMSYGVETSYPYGCPDVYILDFSFNKEILTGIAELANKVILLDHHKTAQAELTIWPEAKPKNLEIVFDMNRSGAAITWDYFSRDEDWPPLIAYIQDHDLWKFLLPYAKEIIARIKMADTAFDSYTNLNKSLVYNFNAIAESGKYLLLQNQNYVKQIVSIARKCSFQKPDGTWIEGLAANCTGQFASDVGSELAKISGTFGGSYYSDKDGSVKYSLRSIGDFDVSAIAKQFGGGGHRNAAGFMLFPNETDRSDEIKLWVIKES